MLLDLGSNTTQLSVINFRIGLIFIKVCRIAENILGVGVNAVGFQVMSS